MKGARVTQDYYLYVKVERYSPFFTSSSRSQGHPRRTPSSRWREIRHFPPVHDRSRGHPRLPNIFIASKRRITTFSRQYPRNVPTCTPPMNGWGAGEGQHVPWCIPYNNVIGASIIQDYICSRLHTTTTFTKRANFPFHQCFTGARLHRQRRERFLISTI